MALRGTLTHRKTRRLARLLAISPCFALGILEALWHYAGEQRTPNGDVSGLSAQDLADELFYDGDAGALLKALQEAGWLTSDVPGVRLYVKGWHEHADSYVQAKLAKQTGLFANGRMPSIPHDAFNADTRKRILAAYEAAYPGITTRGEDGPDASPGASPASPGPSGDPEGTGSGHTSAGGSSGSGTSTREEGEGERASAPAAAFLDGQWAPLGSMLDSADVREELAQIETSRKAKKPIPLGPVPFGDVEILASVMASNGVDEGRFLAFLRYVNKNKWASAKGDMLMRFLKDNKGARGTYNSGEIPKGQGTGNPVNNPVSGGMSEDDIWRLEMQKMGKLPRLPEGAK